MGSDDTPKNTLALTPTNTLLRSVKPQEKPHKKGDGGGLFHNVGPNGTKLWRLKYRSDEEGKTGSRGKAAIDQNIPSLVAAELMAKLEQEGVTETTLTKKRWLLGFAEANFGNVAIRALTGS